MPVAFPGVLVVHANAYRLAIVLRNNLIKGIRVQNTKIKQYLFADDATYINDGSKISFEILMKTIQTFGTISGLKLNTTTSNISYLDGFQFQSDTHDATTLGIVFKSNNTNIF